MLIFVMEMKKYPEIASNENFKAFYNLVQRTKTFAPFLLDI